MNAAPPAHQDNVVDHSQVREVSARHRAVSSATAVVLRPA